MILNFITWNADPTIFSVFGHEVRWYGLLFAMGLYLGMLLITRIFKKEGAPEAWLDKLFFWSVISIVIGSRLGHVFFYEWDYYSANPVEILKIWHGGLASHGGTLAMFIMVLIFSKLIIKENVWWLCDRLFIPSALVAGMIRLGNLMNSEIYGRPTSMPWGVRFMKGNEQFCGDFSDYIMCTAHNCCPQAEWLPCHPTQLYESFTYLLIFALMVYLYWRKEGGRYNGLLSGIGFAGIFGARQLIEMVKNNQSDFEAGMTYNMGQLLSIPFVVGGIYLIIRAIKKGKVTYNIAKK